MYFQEYCFWIGYLGSDRETIVLWDQSGVDLCTDNSRLNASFPVLGKRVDVGCGACVCVDLVELSGRLSALPTTMFPTLGVPALDGAPGTDGKLPPPGPNGYPGAVQYTYNSECCRWQLALLSEYNCRRL